MADVKPRDWRLKARELHTRTHEVRHEGAAYDDTAVRAGLVQLEAAIGDVRAQLQQITAHLKQLEADYQQIRHELAGHTHETIRQVA